MRENLFAEFIYELIEAQVHLGFHFVVQKLFAEYRERVQRAIVVQIQRIQYVSVEKIYDIKNN